VLSRAGTVRDPMSCHGQNSREWSGTFVLVLHSSRTGGARAPTVFPAFGRLRGPMQREESVMSHENVLACGALSFANAAAAS
jgi:hypothetical protein